MLFANVSQLQLDPPFLRSPLLFAFAHAHPCTAKFPLQTSLHTEDVKCIGPQQVHLIEHPISYYTHEMWCDTHKCDAPLFSGYRQTCPQSAGFESHVPAEKLADPPQVESLAVPVLASFETPHDQYTSSWWAVESNQWSLSLNQVETAQQGYCNTYMKENISGVTYKHYSKLFYLSSVWVQWTNSFQVHYLLGTVVQIRTWLLIVYIIQQCNNTVSNFSSITINLQQSIIMWPACWSQSLLSTEHREVIPQRQIPSLLITIPT